MSKRINIPINGFDLNQIGSGGATETVYWNNLDKSSSDTTKIGDEIQRVDNRINNVSARGRFLSGWDCTTGLPVDAPAHLPYEYKTGDYYIISKIGDSGQTNYKPNGTEFNAVPSSTVEWTAIAVGDTYCYTNTGWIYIANDAPVISFAQIAGQPCDNTALDNVLKTKQNKLSMIRLSGTSGTLTQTQYDKLFNAEAFVLLNLVDIYWMIGLDTDQNLYLTHAKLERTGPAVHLEDNVKFGTIIINKETLNWSLITHTHNFTKPSYMSTVQLIETDVVLTAGESKAITYTATEPAGYVFHHYDPHLLFKFVTKNLCFGQIDIDKVTNKTMSAVIVNNSDVTETVNVYALITYRLAD